MNLSDALNTFAAKPSTCKFGGWVDALKPEDRQLVHSALADRDRYTVAHLCRVFSSFGCPVSESSIRTHRVNGCRSCETKK